MKKRAVASIFLCLIIVLAGCGAPAPESTPAPDPAPTVAPAPPAEAPTPDPNAPVPVKGRIILSTTTSTQDSGLLDYLLPVFTKDTGWNVDVISVGTGAALQMGRDGEADVLLVHSKPDEIKLVEDGFGVKRFDVMYNDYVIVGPAGGISHNEDVLETFKAIADGGLPFVSRGDDSGTHKKELAIWKELNINVEDMENYTSVGQGMGATLQMAEELQAYTLSDRATWLTTKSKGVTLEIVCEKSELLLNYYGVIAVTPNLNDKINAEGGQAFVDWMLSDSGQKLVGEFGAAEYGAPLFTPNASANK